jgi:hypothetical protein
MKSNRLNVIDFANAHLLYIQIHGSPNEIPDAIPFREDREDAAYDPAYAQRFWRVLLQADRVFKRDCPRSACWR